LTARVRAWGSGSMTSITHSGRLDVILSFRVRQGCDLQRPVVDSVVDGTLAA
jgi:hypothetical protein